MRLSIIAIMLLFIACRSETAYRTLQVTTRVDIKLPADAIYGNLSSFGGFHAAVPELFLEERLVKTDETITRTLTLSSGDTITDQLYKSDDLSNTIYFNTTNSTLPIDNLIHSIQVEIIAADRSKVTWESEGSVQNKNRDIMNDKIKGIQESYLFSMELLGEELEELLNDPNF